MICSTGSAAADAGLVCGSCILRVGQQDVLRASHEAVVTAIKGSLEDSMDAAGGAAVEIKVSHSNMEHLVPSRRGLQWAHSYSPIPGPV